MIEEQRRGLLTWLARITGRSMAAPMTGATMAEPDEMAAMEPASMAPDLSAPDMAAPDMAAPDMAAPESMEPTTASTSDPARMQSSATQL